MDAKEQEVLHVWKEEIKELAAFETRNERRGNNVRGTVFHIENKGAV